MDHLFWSCVLHSASHDGDGRSYETRVTVLQDVPHRINPASVSAAQLRVSLVLKLVFLPKPDAQKQLSSLARPEWGPAVRFGSAAGRAVAAAAS